MSTGIETTVYGEPTPHRGVDVWTEDSLLRWDWGDVMDIYQGVDVNGARIKSDREFTEFAWPKYGYLASSILSFISAVQNGTEMAISGYDLLRSLEAAVAAKHSALWGSVPLSLPLEDRSLTLYPRPYRWLRRRPVRQIPDAGMKRAHTNSSRRDSASYPPGSAMVNTLAGL